MSVILKAVIPAAGLGLRFLPATKAQPKEMLPVIDKPLIQYAVEEAVTSGIKQVIIVTGVNKKTIEEHFARCPELENLLQQKGNDELLNEILPFSDRVNISYVIQRQPLGLGHAVLMAKEIIGEEPFALILPDDIIISREPLLRQMSELYNRHQANIVAVEKVADEERRKYGIIKFRERVGALYKVEDLVEKPFPEEVFSNLAVAGRYILSPRIFAALEATPPGRNQEIQLTDGLKLLLKEQQILGYRFKGKRYDAGEPLGLLKAAVDFALNRQDIGAEFRDYLDKRLRK